MINTKDTGLARNPTQLAAQLRSKLGNNVQISDSGTVGVQPKGTLQKMRDIGGTVLRTAGKFLPGVWGTAAKLLGEGLNDPEWWQSVPGNQVTLNSPLRDVSVGKVGSTDDFQGEISNLDAYKRRFAIAEFISTSTEMDLNGYAVIRPSATAVTQYLMPEIRKVVNAIPLQAADHYRVSFVVNATIYAMWQQLKKFDYMLKHGQTYLASMNDPSFPLFQVENSAFLQSTIVRLEEYLRANVRLPHTLCEYLAWRYGRVYKSNNSAKAGLVMYNVLDLRQTPEAWSYAIKYLMTQISRSTQYQAANTDLYNAYFDHDQAVHVKEDTQFRYDMKEFMLRTNSRLETPFITDATLNAIVIDSSLDNATAYMASTVSTPGVGDDGNVSILFPVRGIKVYMTFGTVFSATDERNDYNEYFVTAVGTGQDRYPRIKFQVREGSIWGCLNVTPCFYGSQRIYGSTEQNGTDLWIQSMLACKSMDIYNKGLYLMDADSQGNPQFAIDASSISIDTGVVTDDVLGVEHVYAFANLVHQARKRGESYAKAEATVAKELANVIEKVDVAVAK